MTSFALGTFVFPDARAQAAIVLGERAIPLEGACRRLGLELPGAGNLTSLLARWDASLPRLRELARSLADDDRDLASPLPTLEPLAPLQPFGAVFAAGANYRTHVHQIALAARRAAAPDADADALAAEIDRWLDLRAESGRPFVFTGLPRAVCGPRGDIVIPPDVSECDWELELGVVISRAGYRIHRDDALEHVAGYTIVNDVTARDRVMRADAGPMGPDWLAGKSCPGFFPTGPLLVPREAVPDVGGLRMTLRLNGEVMQDATPADLLFDVPRLIEHVSWAAELRPGDLIATGSPAGNGAHHGRFLRHGDVIEAGIAGLGLQRTRFVREERT